MISIPLYAIYPVPNHSLAYLSLRLFYFAAQVVSGTFVNNLCLFRLSGVIVPRWLTHSPMFWNTSYATWKCTQINASTATATLIVQSVLCSPTRLFQIQEPHIVVAYRPTVRDELISGGIKYRVWKTDPKRLSLNHVRVLCVLWMCYYGLRWCGEQMMCNTRAILKSVVFF